MTRTHLRILMLALVIVSGSAAVRWVAAEDHDGVGAWREDTRRPAGHPVQGTSAPSEAEPWSVDSRRPDTYGYTPTKHRVAPWRVDDRRPAPWPKKGADADGDGVLDDDDRCPGTPPGATVDDRGCPRDGDGDGVYDGIDRCPDTPRGATVDDRGCPSDSDGDGVLDGIDRCPDTPRGTTVNANGCSNDDDGDGVPNERDKCPNTPAGTRVDIRGCPMSSGEAQLIDAGMLRLTIHFDTNKATIRSESTARLDDVGEILAKHPDIRVEVGGHTDALGEESYNLTLSQARAEAVRSYWISKFSGIEAGHLVAKGYGESKPVSTNDTPAGRQENRRVELIVLNPEVLR